MIERLRYFFCWRASLLLLVVLLTACSQGLSEGQGQLQGGLLIWHPLQGEVAKMLWNGFTEFQHLNPEVDIVSEYVPQDDLSLRFIQQAKAGLGPSIMINFSRQIPEFVKAKRIQPIDEKEIDLSAYFPPTLAQVRYQGKIYGVPLGLQIPVLCYNQGKIGRSSLLGDKPPVQPPSQLEGLIEQAQRGYSVGMVSSFEDTFWGMGIFGSSIIDSQGFIKPQLEGWAKWIEWLKGASIQPNFILLRDRNILHNAFAQGKLTYYVCNSDEIVDLKNALKDDLRVAPLPEELDHKATPLLYTKVMMFNRSAAPDETRLALALAKFMTNPEQQLQGIVQSQSFIPTNRNVTINRDFLPIEAILLEQSRTAFVIPPDYLERLIPVFEEGELLYQKAIAGDVDPSEAAGQLTLFIDHQIH